VIYRSRKKRKKKYLIAKFKLNFTAAAAVYIHRCLYTPPNRGGGSTLAFGQTKYRGSVIATSMLDWKMDWNCGMDYGIKKNEVSRGLAGSPILQYT